MGTIGEGAEKARLYVEQNGLLLDEKKNEKRLHSICTYMKWYYSCIKLG